MANKRLSFSLLNSVLAIYIFTAIAINYQQLLVSFGFEYQHNIGLVLLTTFLYFIHINLELEFVDYLNIFEPLKIPKIGYLTLKHKQSYGQVFALLFIVQLASRYFGNANSVAATFVNQYAIIFIVVWILSIPTFFIIKRFKTKKVPACLFSNSIKILLLIVIGLRLGMLYLSIKQLDIWYLSILSLQLIFSIFLFHKISNHREKSYAKTSDSK